MKTKWRVCYWDTFKDCEAVKGFYTYEDAITWVEKNKHLHTINQLTLRGTK